MPHLRGVLLQLAGLAAIGLALLSWGCGQKAVQPAAPAPIPPVKATPKAEAKKSGKTLLVFAGTAGKPGIDEVARAFEQAHGVTVSCSYGGSGTVLSQMIVGKMGDVYIPGSDDYMDKAQEKGVLVEGTRKIVCYLVPVIAVQKGNPKGIRTVADMAKPGVRVGIGNPKAVCLGDIAMQIFDEAGITEQVEKNIVTHADSCGQVANLLKLKEVDAAIGWDVFASESPKDIEIIPLPAGAGHERNIPAAVVKFTKDQALAQQFVDFLAESETSHQAFKQHGFTVK